MKKGKKVTETVQETQVVESPAKQIGRPVNPTSARQIKIAERKMKQEQGLLKRGRPVVEGSKRQALILKRNEKISNGIELKRGRPVNPESKRQIELAKKASK